jgi:uncharacterized protein YjbI with pentapeptide repeats
MANEEHLRILNEGVEVWNQWRRDNPNEVPDLSDATLFEMNLSGANFSGTGFSDADFSLANLRSANLCNSDLFNANLSGTCLCGTNFENADLTRSRFILCNLRDAIVENAIVTYIDIQRLEGLPIPPKQLRIKDNNGKEVLLTGYDAREFFNLPAIVEVCVTVELIQEELGCYHFHLGEVHHRGVGTGVFFVGHRHENGGSVLRFQGKSYDDIYQVLTDLLAPFRMVQAVDWKETIRAIPAEERGDAIMALATVEPKPPIVEWRFAKQMAEVFDGYRNANVYQISEGGSRQILIDIIENPDELQRLSQMTLPETWDGRRPLVITQGQHSNLSIGGGNVGNQTEIRGDAIGSAFGSGTVNARDITVYKNAIDSSTGLDSDVKTKFKEAREAIENADLSDDDKADMVEQLNKLTAELEKPEQDDGRVQRFWSRIKEIAPTVASILSSAASLGKILGLA